MKKCNFPVCCRVVCATCADSSVSFNNSFTAARRFVRANHMAMLGDLRRLQVYRKAIDVVAASANSALEVGCGPLCVLGINAARAGTLSYVFLLYSSLVACSFSPCCCSCSSCFSCSCSACWSYFSWILNILTSPAPPALSPTFQLGA